MRRRRSRRSGADVDVLLTNRPSSIMVEAEHMLLMETQRLAPTPPLAWDESPLRLCELAPHESELMLILARESVLSNYGPRRGRERDSSIMVRSSRSLSAPRSVSIDLRPPEEISHSTTSIASLAQFNFFNEQQQTLQPLRRLSVHTGRRRSTSAVSAIDSRYPRPVRRMAALLQPVVAWEQGIEYCSLIGGNRDTLLINGYYSSYFIGCMSFGICQFWCRVLIMSTLVLAIPPPCWSRQHS